jgi:hypothetical protein
MVFSASFFAKPHGCAIYSKKFLNNLFAHQKSVRGIIRLSFSIFAYLAWVFVASDLSFFCATF